MGLCSWLFRRRKKSDNRKAKQSTQSTKRELVAPSQPSKPRDAYVEPAPVPYRILRSEGASLADSLADAGPTRKLDRRLELAAEAWRMFERFRQRDCVLARGMPILYFGDWEAYRNSKRRIITVGLNPSGREFPEKNPFQRFPAAKLSAAKLSAAMQMGEGTSLDESLQTYLLSLDAYFRCDPLDWFRNLENMLTGFDCSFYGAAANTALHTDFCSPLATDPTWSELPRDDREKLSEAGIILWHALVTELRPHVILISIDKRYIEQIRFAPLTSSSLIHSVKCANGSPYNFSHRKYVVSADWNVDMIFGRAWYLPFRHLREKQKQRASSALSALIFRDAEERGT